MKLFLANCSHLPPNASVGLLVPTDQPDINRLSRTQDRVRLIKLRNLRRLILSHYLGTPLQQLEFIDVDGKPSLPGRPDIHFSTASSGEFFAIAISDQPVGVDLEVFNQQSHSENRDLSDHLFHPYERQAQTQAKPQEWQKIFYLIWTQKEAYSKARGLGFGIDFDNFAVSTTGGAVLEGKDHPSPGGWYTSPIESCWPLVVAVAQAEPIPVVEPDWFDWPL
ncbi:MAG: 4'-phosphopantetheinyl transferase superfamily protein [Rhizobiaceae bacterium]